MEQSSNKNKFHISFITKILAILIVVALFSYYFYVVSYNKRQIISKTVNENWNVYLNSELIYENSNLSDVSFKNLKRGDVVSLTTFVNLDSGFEDAIMLYRSLHSGTEVYFGNELIYTNGMELYENNQFTGWGDHFVDIRKLSSFAELKIMFYINDPAGFGKLSPPVFYQKIDAVGVVITNRIISLFCSVFLIVLGAVLLILASMSSIFKNVSIIKIAGLSLFSVIIGFWLFYYSGSVRMFNLPINFTSTIENIAFFLIFTPIMIYYMPDKETIKSKLVAKVYVIVFALQLLFSAIVFLCHFTNTIRFPAFIMCQHGFVGMSLLALVWLMIKQFNKEHNLAEQIVALGGVFAIFLGFISELFSYYIEKYLILFNINNGAIISLCSVCFVLSILLAHLLLTSKTYEKGMERDLFRSYAYTDELTQVGSRHFAEELLMQLNADKKSYTLYSLDLNDLKKTNDTWGHAEGDKMLKSFTKLLKSVFSSDSCNIARTGGDEFIVIDIENGANINPEDRITKLRLMMEAYNNEANGSKYKLSAAIGYVNSNDFVGQTPYELWNMADKRMYENKRELKNAIV